MQQTSGSGVRELGDAILMAAGLAAVVQVKARTEHGQSIERERSWLDSRIAKATRQAAGTIRKLATKPAVTLINERNRGIEIIPAGKTWLSVVVIDHPGVADYVPRESAIVLLRRDWDFLFDQLRSTVAVLQYLDRIKDMAPVALGTETVRYYELASADAAAEPGAVDSRLIEAGGYQISGPLLPRTPAGSDSPFHFVLRTLLEDIATAPVRPDAFAALLDVLAAVDALPIAHRTDIGRELLQWFHDMPPADSDTYMWRTKTIDLPGRPTIILAANNQHDALSREAFGKYVRLRHQQLAELDSSDLEMMTVGVMITPRHDERRPWDTSMVATRGDQQFTVEERASLERLWGLPGHRQPEA
jgi:hypothetical protein